MPKSLIIKDYLVRSAALEGFIPLMHELGIDGATLIADAGIADDSLATPDSTISYAAFLDVLAAAREASGLQHIGLLIAERQSMSILGPLGFAIAQAPDVRELSSTSSSTFTIAALPLVW